MSGNQQEENTTTPETQAQETMSEADESLTEKSTSGETHTETEPEPSETLTEQEYKDLISSLTEDLEQKSSEVEELTGRLRAISAAYSKQTDEVKRTKARLERQSAWEARKNRGDVVSKLFEPFENLKRSVELLQKSDGGQEFVDGLEMVQKSFLSSFFELGLEELPGVGSTFDPNIHKALMKTPVDKPELHNVIVNVYSTGYRINEIIIRTAQVIVGECPKSILDAAKEASLPIEVEEITNQESAVSESNSDEDSTQSQAGSETGSNES